jgi:hypothetical protein
MSRQLLLIQIEPPGAATVDCGIENTTRNGDAQAIDGHHGQTWSGVYPGGGMSLQELDAEVGRDVEVAQLAIVGDTGDWRVTEVIADIFPGGLARGGIIGHNEDMAGSRWGVGVVA